MVLPYRVKCVGHDYTSQSLQKISPDTGVEELPAGRRIPATCAGG